VDTAIQKVKRISMAALVVGIFVGIMLLVQHLTGKTDGRPYGFLLKLMISILQAVLS